MIKTVLASSALLVATATAGLAECKWGHEQAVMTCAEGTVYDAETKSCKALSG
ncbi:carbohydrate-binding module family 14 protein [Marivita sp. GX14005]|uniref:carbohydrate-binding module family 14 protein n=1 Tax=Marivita sp. GX14005 TaxID=2942276 RepID=UPI0020197926|nr:carbohydrate-binding module family 14 protein [Marivita sp. GX14005]MCL3882580.1 carbohydrate-binding module family 14 protein [Marivita sp. GX14005]